MAYDSVMSEKIKNSELEFVKLLERAATGQTTPDDQAAFAKKALSLRSVFIGEAIETAFKADHTVGAVIRREDLNTLCRGVDWSSLAVAALLALEMFDSSEGETDHG